MGPKTHASTCLVGVKFAFLSSETTLNPKCQSVRASDNLNEKPDVFFAVMSFQQIVRQISVRQLIKP